MNAESEKVGADGLGAEVADPQPRETNSRIAHEHLVTAKYALHALAVDTSLSATEREQWRTYAEQAEELVGQAQHLRFSAKAEPADDATGRGRR